MRRQAGGSVGGELVEAGSVDLAAAGSVDLAAAVTSTMAARSRSSQAHIQARCGFFFFFFVYFHQLTTVGISRPPRLISHLPWPLDHGGRLCPPRKT